MPQGTGYLPGGGKKKKMKTPPLGTGERFDSVVKSMTDKGMPEERAKKIAAMVGRKKYGKAKFQKMAAKGKKRMSESAYGEMYIPKHR
jgi:aminopeptidase N